LGIGNWEQPDQSIWEVRGGRRDFTYSKVQCWVALDRGLRLAWKRSFPADTQRWLTERDRIYRAVMSRAWNEREGAFTQSFDSDALDSSTLLMPLMLFVSPVDPRMVATIERIRQKLASDSLVLRYDTGKAPMTVCRDTKASSLSVPFGWWRRWRAAGYVEDAQLLFEKLLSYANHLGLFSEEISSRGELLGNYPQALTHLG